MGFVVTGYTPLEDYNTPIVMQLRETFTVTVQCQRPDPIAPMQTEDGNRLYSAET